MTKKTGDIVAKTGDEPTVIQSVDPNVDTKILTPEQDVYKTNKVSGSDTQATPPDPFSPTANIGDYRIIRKIGEGGMGVVYEAEQQHPRRLVALKVIRGGLGVNEQLVKMFEREIEALARLKHPGIASIYESGRSDDGQLFFAMELVQGIELTDFVEKQRSMSGGQPVSVNSQLALFSQIGEVVNYAHQRGVIHRDLKPQNILVTDAGDDRSSLSGSGTGVKILDFGLARINDPEFRGNTDVSQMGQIKGTLLYMSPEQVRGNPDEIDIRSDVYALGVMLYELLSGRMPYDLSKASLPEAMRIICEEPPLSLSVALTETYGRQARIDRDVETIVLKALEKDPDRRYQSVAAMLEDIERYLTNQPILARPPSAFYQFRKLVERHKVAFAGLAIIFALLSGFGVVMAAQSVRIANERDKAEQARGEAEEQKNQAEKARNEALIARNEEKKQRDIAEQNLTRAESEQKRAEDEKVKAENAQKAEAEQRKIADVNLIEAKQQKEVANKQTSIAVNQAEENRRQLYISQMNLADQAWEQADIPRMVELLENQIPSAAQVDLRGFEWYHLWRKTHRELLSVKSPGSTMIASLAPNGRTMAITTVVWPSFNTAATYRTIVRDESGNELGNFEGRVVLGYLSDQRLLTVKNQKVEIVDPFTKVVQPLDLDASLSTPILSRDGRLVATFTNQNTILVTDLISGSVTRVLDGAVSISQQGGLLGQVAPSVAFSHDGRTLAAIAGDTIKVWTIERGGTPDLINVGSDWPMGIAVSPDGTLVATRAVDDRVVKIWGVQTKKLIATFSSENSNPRTGSGFKRIEFSPDGKFLAATQGRAVSLWQLPDGRLVDEIKGHGDTVTTLSFTSDGKALLTGGTDEVKLWPLPLDDSFPSVDEKLFFGTLSDNGKLLATTEMFGALQLWDPVTLLQLGELRGNDRSRGALPMFPRLSPDGKILLVWQFQIPIVAQDDAGKILSTGVSMGGVAEIWDTTSRVKLGTLPGQILPVSGFSPDGKVVAAQEVDPKDGARSLVLWDLSTQKSIFKFPGGHSAAFSPNGELIAITTRDTIKLLDAKTKSVLDPGFDVKTRFASSAVTFSPNGDLIAYADGKKVVILDLKTRKSVGTLKGHSSDVAHLTYTPDGKRIASVDQSGAVKLWDVATCSLVSTPIGEGIPQPVVFAPDGRSMIVGGKYGLRILRAATDEDVKKQRGSEYYRTALPFYLRQSRYKSWCSN